MVRQVRNTCGFVNCKASIRCQLLLGLPKESPTFKMGTSLFSSRKSPSDVFCACARLKKVSGVAEHMICLQSSRAELKCFTIDQVKRSHLSLVESQRLQA